MKNSDKFLQDHRMSAADVEIQKVVDAFLSEMSKGLEGKESSLHMIPTYIEADNEFLTNTPVVAIDAGGTNFRAAKIKFDKNSNLEMSNMVNARMPGIDREVSKNEFFQTMAGYIRELAEETDRIGFCFSYATEILPNKDGRLIQFSKEIQAPEVVGELIGKNLLEALGTPNKQIVLLNDTVATLLAGKSSSQIKNYDSYIGFILGTGTNTCYIESNQNILKKPELDPDKNQIINMETGNFGKGPRADLDIAFDNTTSNPGTYTFEKMFSGGYFGGLCLSVLKTAAREGLFSGETTDNILSLDELTVEALNRFVSKSTDDREPLYSCMANATDEETCIGIIEGLIERSAKLVAANLAAAVLKTGKGKPADRPILITIEGTTFYRLHKLKPLFEEYMEEYLSDERQRYFEFNQVENSSLVGAALAALVE
ncbi:MAG: hexokinase family protein [Bacteroidota bacterium]